MARLSDFERAQIQALLSTQPRSIIPGTALYISPQMTLHDDVYEMCIVPALYKNSIITSVPHCVVDSDSPVSELYEQIQTTELLFFDLTTMVPEVLYALGLAHAIGRYPLILHQKQTAPPFDLTAVRRISYTPDADGLRNLRSELTRAIRIHLAGIRAAERNTDAG
ncbi:MAG TPA: hypothetical protein VFE58_00920 [Tepidisphaeraceae bacterium]|jgi:hypothetical protein|nr:hypothetical protein [Tepidisphaeraceae bacterium]